MSMWNEGPMGNVQSCHWSCGKGLLFWSRINKHRPGGAARTLCVAELQSFWKSHVSWWQFSIRYIAVCFFRFWFNWYIPTLYDILIFHVYYNLNLGRENLTRISIMALIGCVNDYGLHGQIYACICSIHVLVYICNQLVPSAKVVIPKSIIFF